MLKKITLRKIAGAILIILGLTLHIIPFFPAGWIVFLGIEFLGIRLLLQDKFQFYLKKFKLFNITKKINTTNYENFYLRQ